MAGLSKYFIHATNVPKQNVTDHCTRGIIAILDGTLPYARNYVVGANKDFSSTYKIRKLKEGEYVLTEGNIVDSWGKSFVPSRSANITIAKSEICSRLSAMGIVHIYSPRGSDLAPSALSQKFSALSKKLSTVTGGTTSVRRK
jgi:hypothetical protein